MQVINTNLRVVIEDELDYMSLQQALAIALKRVSNSSLKGRALVNA
jgi:hypothetical protein